MVAALGVPVPPDGQAAGWKWWRRWTRSSTMAMIMSWIVDLGPAEKVSPRVESLGKRFDAIAREPIIV